MIDAFRPRRRTAVAGTAALVAFCLATPLCASASAAPAAAADAPAIAPEAAPAAPQHKTPAERILGAKPRSGLPWFSGIWRGAPHTAAAVDNVGHWRGHPIDAVTSYSNKRVLHPSSGPDSLADSRWNVSTFSGFGGLMSYNLAMIPSDNSVTFDSIIKGDQDEVWRLNARALKENGRGNALVNIGWEANGDWYKWSATYLNAPKFRDAWNRIAMVMKQETPGLKFGFIIGCGRAMTGQLNRMDSLERLYPGNERVDVVGCNDYDWWHIKGRNEREWKKRINPPLAAGLADVAAFARKHQKGFAVSEWGLSATDKHGSGDNPFYIRKMFEFFEQNKDVLVMENYFMEAEGNVTNSLHNPAQMPKSAEAYKESINRIKR
ncbi:hypothetical protein SAMN05421595_2604 [Austwickia chelonae]|uniref:GH26 domain-containing protein n=1 Tax=Austwickia chelonae NBRC 105200 TaxID=1184607 RepID=K6VVC2_9MICO|nr:hypothetical protein [Austwickia chelonae]GAB79295.1 hypothetical protein AUCHE_22_00650 [Austwickia chelonae NBRC 105200]SEW38005.1 hypothetical protein SAMN05421595_2604 [Austwickia chelonae]